MMADGLGGMPNPQVVRDELRRMAADASLDVPANLVQREEALYLLAYVEDLIARGATGGEAAHLQAYAAAQRARLEAASERLCDEYRRAIRSGRLAGEPLRRRLCRYTDYRPTPGGAAHTRYEPLDVLVGGVFGLDHAPDEDLPRVPGMIQLEFTPASVVLEMVDRVALGSEDRFVDVGSGLGQVAMLVHLLTGVPSQGIEYQPGYAAQARRCAEALQLGRVTFVQGDAREADLSSGTVFYLFTPFVGGVLDDVLGRIRQHAAHRRVRILSYGASSVQVGRQAWLRSLDGNAHREFHLAVYQST